MRYRIEQTIIDLGLVRATKSLFDEIPKEYRGSNHTYQKFIVLAHQRSGSSLVIRSLRAHPNIIAYGEMFGRFKPHATTEFNSKPLQKRYLRKKYPNEFFDRRIYSSVRNDIQAVGFKLFPHQLDNKYFLNVWNQIQQNKDIKIIFLRRKNLLASYTSLQAAKKTGIYNIRNESQRTEPTVKINYKRCIKYFMDMEKYIELASEKLQYHDLLEITYEDMIVDLEKSFAKFQEFLGVEVVSLEPKTIKREIRPLWKVISNYEQLHNQLLNTKWDMFLREGNSG